MSQFESSQQDVPIQPAEFEEALAEREEQAAPPPATSKLKVSWRIFADTICSLHWSITTALILAAVASVSALGLAIALYYVTRTPENHLLLLMQILFASIAVLKSLIDGLWLAHDKSKVPTGITSS